MLSEGHRIAGALNSSGFVTHHIGNYFNKADNAFMELDLGEELRYAIGKIIFIGLLEITMNSQLGHKNSSSVF